MEENWSEDSDETEFLALFAQRYFDNTSRYEEQSKALLTMKSLDVTFGDQILRYQLDSDRSCFKLSEDGGDTFSNILSSYAMAESNEDNIQILREQFANTEARLALLG